jgi:ornithine--oxo-acid transaminase
MATRIRELLKERAGEGLDLHDEHLNSQLVKVLRTLGFDRNYVRAEGAYLFDAEGRRYLDLLSGFGVFGVGRNHPKVVEALGDVLDARLPGMLQLGVSLLAGVLAERLLATLPDSIEKAFFCNSGAEAVEGAIKFSRYATGRPGLVYCEKAFHGLTTGALSLNGDEIFREGFGPLLPDTHRVPFDDLEALEAVLARGDIAAFFVEPIQGHGVNVPSVAYLPEAARLCRNHGALLVVDEIQTGLARTGRMWAFEHWQVEPDIVLAAKALSGGFAPVGAILMRRKIFDALFSNMVRAPVHGSTFSKNDLAMAAGIATLEVIEDEGLVGHAERLGEAILADLRGLAKRHACIAEVRGRGMMQAVEFAPPDSLKHRAAWKMLDAAQKGLFSQLVVVPLFNDHGILSQTAAHDLAVVKFLPPLCIGDEDRRWIVGAMDEVVGATENVGGAIWDLGKNLASAAIRTRSGRS